MGAGGVEETEYPVSLDIKNYFQTKDFPSRYERQRIENVTF